MPEEHRTPETTATIDLRNALDALREEISTTRNT